MTGAREYKVRTTRSTIEGALFRYFFSLKDGVHLPQIVGMSNLDLEKNVLYTWATGLFAGMDAFRFLLKSVFG